MLIVCSADTLLCRYYVMPIVCCAVLIVSCANVMQVLMVCCSGMDVMPPVVVLIVCANAMPSGWSPLYVLLIVCCANSGLKYVGPSNT